MAYKRPKLSEDVKLADYTALIAEWEEANENAKAWKEIELELRNKIVSETFGDHSQLKGSTTLLLDKAMGTDVKLTVKFDVNEKFDKGGVPTIRAALGTEKCNDLFKATVSLVAATYKELEGDELLTVNEFVTRTPAQPSLTLKRPKTEE